MSGQEAAPEMLSMLYFLPPVCEAMVSGCATLGTPVWIDGPGGVTWPLPLDLSVRFPWRLLLKPFLKPLTQAYLLVLSPSCVCWNSSGGLSAFVALTVMYQRMGYVSLFMWQCWSGTIHLDQVTYAYMSLVPSQTLFCLVCPI